MNKTNRVKLKIGQVVKFKFQLIEKTNSTDATEWQKLMVSLPSS